MPWPLSQLDRSQAATRRRGVRLIHVVVLVMAGGTGFLTLGAWTLLVVAVGFGVFVYRAPGRYFELVESVDRLGTQLTEVYAKIEETQRVAAERESSLDPVHRQPPPQERD